MITLLLLSTLSFSSFARDVKKIDAQGVSKNQIESVLSEAYSQFRGVKEGKNADYIPALKEVNSELFGIVIVTPDGKVYSKGDVDHEFSIQSISKVFTLAQVLQESGSDKVLRTVGVDATGDVFNSIVAIEKHEGKQMNPFVNPGAIATTSMVKGANSDAIWKKIIKVHSLFAGRDLAVNEEVYRSESATNQRNQAIAKLMDAYKLMDAKPEQTTDLYTRQCSISVNAKDLAVMAATLANGGINPVTKTRAVHQEYVSRILAVMSTAGLYDKSGEWLYSSGLPAKSGVGGGIIAISPGKVGIAAFSPRLDEAGNSVRAQRAIAYISEKLKINPYDVEPYVGRDIMAEEEDK